MSRKYPYRYRIIDQWGMPCCAGGHLTVSAAKKHAARRWRERSVLPILEHPLLQRRDHVAGAHWIELDVGLCEEWR